MSTSNTRTLVAQDEDAIASVAETPKIKVQQAYSRFQNVGLKARVSGLILIALVCVAAFATLASPTLGSRPNHRNESGNTVAAFTGVVPIFQQCGGADYKGPKSCQPGCFCRKDNDYFFSCKPPEGETHCDEVAGALAAKKAQALVQALKPKEKQLKQRMQELKKMALKAKKEYESLRNSTKPLLAAQKNKTAIYNKVKAVKEEADAVAASHGVSADSKETAAKTAEQNEKSLKKASEEVAAEAEKAKGKAQYLAKAAGIADPFA